MNLYEDEKRIINRKKKQNKIKRKKKYLIFLKIKICILFFSFILILFALRLIFMKKPYKKSLNENYSNNNSNNNSYNNLNNNITVFPESIIFISYAQFLEDLILLCFFYDIKNGFYIDVGANSPNEYSVTKYFYYQGWNGINIEPLEKEYDSLVKERPRDINLNILAGNETGNKTFYMHETLSTYKKNLSKPNYIPKNVEIDTMTNICRKYIPKDKKIDFCKIDVEGAEKDVLLGYDFENYRPKVLCIESISVLDKSPIQSTFEYILFKNDYSFAYEYKSNRFYVDNKIEGLKERINLIDGTIKLYKSNFVRN